ncbi:MAG: flavin reductase family protein [Myxococcota bacterium]|nr:flavin reductase family protein [Myxococcota bacterium]
MTKHELKDISWDDAITLASPHPYVLVTSADGKGKSSIVGVGWWTITSWEPPMLAISLAHKRYSRELIEASGEFVVCLVGEEHARGAWVCGTKSGRRIDKFAETGFTPIGSLKVKAPTIGESVLALECSVRGKLETGDHILYAGEIVAIRGVSGRPGHLYSIHYRELIAIGADGSMRTGLPFKG